MMISPFLLVDIYPNCVASRERRPGHRFSQINATELPIGRLHLETLERG